MGRVHGGMPTTCVVWPHMPGTPQTSLVFRAQDWTVSINWILIGYFLCKIGKYISKILNSLSSLHALNAGKVFVCLLKLIFINYFINQHWKSLNLYLYCICTH